METVNTPKRRDFFHHTVLKILAIQKVFLQFLPCLLTQSFAVGHIAHFQTRPNCVLCAMQKRSGEDQG